MKFKIRYADKIVGSLTIAAFCALVAVIFLLGTKQRWFAKDFDFHTVFDSANGLSIGMPVQYKGFTVGKVKKISLTDSDNVDMTFCIFDTYYNRVREGSLIELVISPIGLGNQLLFYPGNGTSTLAEYSEVPRAGSEEGKRLVDSGMVVIPKRDDTIANLTAQIGPLLANANSTLEQLNGALNGKGKGPLAETMTNLSQISGTLDTYLSTLLANVTEITANLSQLSENIKDPKGLVPTLVDPDGKIFASIQNTLDSVNGMVKNLEASTGMLKTDMPEIAVLISQLNTSLVKAQAVLDGLRNNPLLKGGIQEQKPAETAGGVLKDADF